eukprot:8146982-Pyramimonas_sp.AAC.1
MSGVPNWAVVARVIAPSEAPFLWGTICVMGVPSGVVVSHAFAPTDAPPTSYVQAPEARWWDRPGATT